MDANLVPTVLSLNTLSLEQYATKNEGLHQLEITLNCKLLPKTPVS